MKESGEMQDQRRVTGDAHLDVATVGTGIAAARRGDAENSDADRRGFDLLGFPARQRRRQQRREILGVLLPDQLRGEIKRLLGACHIAGLIGFAGRLDGVEDVVGGKRGHCRQRHENRAAYDPQHGSPSGCGPDET